MTPTTDLHKINELFTVHARLQVGVNVGMTEVGQRGGPGQAEPVAQKGAQALERGAAIL